MTHDPRYGPGTSANLPFSILEEMLLPPDAEHRTQAMATRFGVNRRTVQGWRKRGVPWWTADRLAIHLNLHPAIIWPTWAEDVVLSEDDEAA